MGYAEVNLDENFHGQPSGLREYRWHYHQETLSDDSWSPTFTMAQWAAMLDAAATGTRSTWEASMPSTLASWYNARPTLYKNFRWTVAQEQATALGL